jgi:hypothetical protein
MKAEDKVKHVAAAQHCLWEAVVALNKANDLLFDAGWQVGTLGPRLTTMDNIHEALAATRHARTLVVGSNWGN